MSKQFSPQYEDEDIRKLLSKIIKYVTIPRYRDILYYFLLPHQVLRTVTAMDGRRHLILIEALGEVNEAKLQELRDLYHADFIELLNTPLGSEMLRRFSPEEVTGMEPQQYLVLMQQLIQQVPEFRDVLTEMSRSGIPVILPLSLYRSIAMSIATTLHRIYMNQHYRDKLRTVIDILSREGLIEPIYQVEICYRKECRYVRISVPAEPASKRNYVCPVCGTPILVFKVYAIDPLLSKLKIDRGVDLPILIREYLRFRSLGGLKVFGPCTHDKKSELDVVIPDKGVGIECKLYKSRVFTEHDAKSEAGKLEKELMKYWEASLTEVILVTNLDDRSAELLEKELKPRISRMKNGCTLKVVSGDVNKLISMLDALI